jgi:hypothetical protein
MAENPALAKQVLEKAMRPKEEESKKEEPPPTFDGPPDGVFQLCGGYFQDDGAWTTEFEVREFTGRDEEFLARIKDPAKTLIAIVERGLVRVGNDRASPQVLDSLYQGDWDSVLLAIRIVTFGPTVDITTNCRNCGETYAAVIDLRENIEYRKASKEDRVYTVEGRNAVFTVGQAMGELQRKILLESKDATAAEMNTMVLAHCVQKIGSVPVIGPDAVRNLSVADRLTLLKAIDESRVGPQVKEVRTECPTCGADQEVGISIAAMFR